jgi:hypothetical protein
MALAGLGGGIALGGDAILPIDYPAVIPESLLLEEHEVVTIALDDPGVGDVAFEVLAVEEVRVGLGAEVGGLEVRKIKVEAPVEFESFLQVAADAV